MLETTALWKSARALRAERDANMPEAVTRARTIGALGDGLIGDLIEETSGRLAANPPASLADLRQRSGYLRGELSEEGCAETVGFSPEIDRGKRELKSFLSENFYRHPDVLRRVRKAEWIVGDLFRTYRDDPNLLPTDVRARFAREGEPRAVSDYIAGMTDRFAMDEHKKLFDPHAPI